MLFFEDPENGKMLQGIYKELEKAMLENKPDIIKSQLSKMFEKEINVVLALKDNDFGKTLIEYAVLEKKWDCVAVFAENTNWNDNSYLPTLLEIAITENKPNIIPHLLRKLSNENLAAVLALTNNEFKKPQIEYAAFLGHWDCVTAITQFAKWKLNQYLYDLIIQAIDNEKSNNPITVKYFLDKMSADDVNMVLTRTDNEFKKPLIEYATFKEKWASATAIPLYKKCDTENEKYYAQILFAGVKAKKLELVKVLLEAGTPINCKFLEEDFDGYHLHHAVKNKQKEMVELLLEFGADENQKNFFGETPKQLAENTNCASCFENKNIEANDIQTIKFGR